MSAEAGYVYTWQVGAFTVTLSMPPIVPGAVRHAVCEWAPSLPGRRLTPTEQRQYDAGLAAATACAPARGFDARTSSASDARGKQ